jgi:VIT1/CCC1 family predicted Fe2+/Mn2+ transporter
MAKDFSLVQTAFTEERNPDGRATTIRQMVFGMNDGLVATVGLVTGLIFSGSSRAVILAATLAAIIAAVSSMALGSFLATKTEVEYLEAQIQQESRELEEDPEQELDEMRQIYRQYGFADAETEILLTRLKADKSLWLQLMLRDELGILPESFENPWSNAGWMALAVALGSLPPLLPIILGTQPKAALIWVISLSALTAFSLGGVTATVTANRWWRAGISFLLVATIAALIGMGAGTLIAPLLNSH